MSYRMYAAPTAMLFGYDPTEIPKDHLVWLVEKVVEEALNSPQTQKQSGLSGFNSKLGQPAFNPKLCAKVLIYGYATGVRSSRQLERLCRESLPFLLLTRGDTPCYRVV